MGKRKSIFCKSRKLREYCRRHHLNYSPNSKARKAENFIENRRLKVSSIPSPEKRIISKDDRKRMAQLRSRTKAFLKQKPKGVPRVLRSPRVVLKKLSEADIVEMKNDRFDRGQRRTSSPFDNDGRIFSKHNLGRQPVTADFPARFYFGSMNKLCEFCGSLSFQKETKYCCCQNGKVALNPLSVYPEELEHLFTSDSEDGKNFRKYIRKYNNLFAFASTKMRQASDLPVQRFGTGVIRISGHVFHKTGQLHPSRGKEPMYNHFYIYDGEEAVEQRCTSLLYDANLLRHVTDTIQNVIDCNNNFARSYRHLFQIEQEERSKALSEGREPVEYRMKFVERAPGSRTSNKPVTQEVAAVFSSDDGAPPKREFVVRTLNNDFQFLDDIDPKVDPLCYPLLFPCGDLGYSLGIPHVGENATAVRNRVTLREYYNYRLSIRNEGFNPLFHSGMLFQQFLVDAYVKIEANRLFYVRKNQSNLRVDKYKGLLDYLENRHGGAAGTPVILPSTYEGSPRSQQMRYQDSMAVVGKYGKPDLFITVTCNPKWPEIVQNLRPGQNAYNAPHLTARVFQMYKDQIVDEIWKDGVLGKCATKIGVVEFQKRGLPHCHLLVHLKAEDKLLTPADVDSLISAEIPDERLQPLLYDTVKNCMMHGPCGNLRPNCPCMQDNGEGLKCSKKFPKAHNNETKLVGKTAYPEYRRREMPDRVVKKTGNFGTVFLDNRWVVPYNPYLTQKFNCHINVESCHNIQAVKYIYKYIYKGHDEGSLQFDQGTNDFSYNEIEDYVEGRYVSAPEAAWRIFSFPMHENSHVVDRLPCHLPDSQNVYFREGEEEAAVTSLKDSKLTAWFKYNAKNPSVNLLYIEMVHDHIFEKNSWRVRKRKAKKPIVGRMYNVSPRDVERFHLRLLLLHVRGAKSYKDLRTVDGTCHETFKEACFALGLITDNTGYVKTMRDTVHYAKPAQCRRVFAYLLLFCDVSNVPELWEAFKNDLCEDFLRHGHSGINAEHLALRSIDSLLKRNGSSNVEHGLPYTEADGDEDTEEQVSCTRNELDKIYETLNEDQRAAADGICERISNFDNSADNLFSIDGPAGTGKTYLYNYILKYCAAHNIKALPSAWVGIAATLLGNGKTCHSTFKLPVPCLDGSKCNVSPNSNHAEKLRSTTLFIIDEISSVSLYAIEAIDVMMRDVCGNNFPFGGKVFVFGGDFRQTLTVVKNSSPADVLNACVVSSKLWSLCERFSLKLNMRARKDEAEFARFLLKLGCDCLPKKETDPFKNSVEVPDRCVVSSDICSLIFPNNLSKEDTASRVILTPTNKVSLDLNDKILERVLPGSCQVIHSADSVVSEDEGDVEMYPVDFLNSLTPTGMPPHSLKLKVGAVVMLLRNFDLKAGLTNGTRLKVLRIHKRLLRVQILCGFHAGQIHHLPKIIFQPSDSGLPFTLRRVQFPIRLAYCMTINKSQGQTFSKVGLYLEKPCFSHGQLYVAFSRARAFQDVHVFVKPYGNSQGVEKGHWYTNNVVMHTVLSAAGVTYAEPSLPPDRATTFVSPARIGPRPEKETMTPLRQFYETGCESPADSVMSFLSSLMSPMSISSDNADFTIETRAPDIITAPSLRRIEVPAPQTGLVNLGNTCYANSILQVLCNVSHLWGEPSGFHESNIVYSMNDSFRHMLNALGTFRPTQFVERLVEIMPGGFNPHAQQDVPEVMLNLLSELVDTEYVFSNHLRVLCGVDLLCTVCATNSSRDEVFNILSVGLGVSVQASIEQLLLPEFVADVHCDQCNGLQEKLKTTTFRNLPTILVIQLKRFTCVGGRYIKSNQNVNINAALNLTTVDGGTNDQNHVRYVLSGTVHHAGNFQAGHYWACIRYNDRWFECNDTVISSTSVNALEESSVYVLVYVREDV